MESLDQELHIFFYTNTGSVPSQGTLWEVSKAVIRGVARGLVHAKRSERMTQLAHLESRAERLETALLRGGKGDSSQQLTVVCEEIRWVSLESAKMLWRSSVARIYGWGTRMVSSSTI